LQIITMTMATTEQAVPDPSPPKNTVVFQCVECLQIVADSLSWVCSHTQLNSFTVATGTLPRPHVNAVATKAVVVSDILDTSREGVDLGRYRVSHNCALI
jgi:hypothetical protein